MHLQKVLEQVKKGLTKNTTAENNLEIDKYAISGCATPSWKTKVKMEFLVGKLVSGANIMVKNNTFEMASRTPKRRILPPMVVSLLPNSQL